MKSLPIEVLIQYRRLRQVDQIPPDILREIVLKQFNYMRINGINLVQDADDLVNLYLKIAKKFPE